MKIKKIVATVLSIILMLSTMSMMSFAFENDEYDIESLTWDDVMSMDNTEFQKLLNQFEREYDPFGTYETNPLTENRKQLSINTGIEPAWTAGEYETIDGELVAKKAGAHEMITAKACGLLYNDKGFWGGNENGSILIALVLSIASTLPDRESDLNKNIYEGHFYNPNTEKSYTLSKSNTAKTNVEHFYNLSKLGYTESQSINTENIGRMIHYIQDACEPHHAANIISLGAKSAHGKFEIFAYDNIDTYLDSLTTINSYKYSDALKLEAGQLLKDAAFTAYAYSNSVKSVLDTSQWASTANDTVRNAAIQTALLLYKLSIDAGIPLVKG